MLKVTKAKGGEQGLLNIVSSSRMVDGVGAPNVIVLF